MHPGECFEELCGAYAAGAELDTKYYIPRKAAEIMNKYWHTCQKEYSTHVKILQVLKGT